MEALISINRLHAVVPDNVHPFPFFVPALDPVVLVEADDMNEPISDAVRAILDGHIILSRDLAMQNHYPAIDILNSVSRIMVDIMGLKHMENANKLKAILDTYRKAEDLINIGAYAAGSNPKIDYAIDMIDKVNGYLRQGVMEDVTFEDSTKQLENLFC